jgi:hypothetical protein
LIPEAKKKVKRKEEAGTRRKDPEKKGIER